MHKIIQEINELSDCVWNNEYSNKIENFAVKIVASIAMSNSTVYWLDVHSNPDHLFQHLMENNDNIQQNNDGTWRLQTIENQMEVDGASGNILNHNYNNHFHVNSIWFTLEPPKWSIFVILFVDPKEYLKVTLTGYEAGRSVPMRTRVQWHTQTLIHTFLCISLHLHWA